MRMVFCHVKHRPLVVLLLAGCHDAPVRYYITMFMLMRFTMPDLLRFILDHARSALRSLVSVRFHANMIPIVVVPLLLWLYLKGTAGTGEVSAQAPQLIVFVFLAGALGGITNTYQRLKSMPLEEPERSMFSNVIAITQVYATPMVAGTFAIVAYALFASGLLEGTLFPSFSGGGTDYKDLNSVFNGMAPSTSADAAKAIIWGFIAGFSEKMIPNILDKMGEDAAAKGNQEQVL